MEAYGKTYISIYDPDNTDAKKEGQRIKYIKNVFLEYIKWDGLFPANCRTKVVFHHDRGQRRSQGYVKLCAW